MEKLIASCGLDCRECPAFIASATNDQTLRVKTAEEWSKAFQFAFTPDMINCHGCHATDGVQIGHCSQCEIRACAQGKGWKTCAGCGDLDTCPQATEFHSHSPAARANLDALRR